jgi:hypothetical protein
MGVCGASVVHPWWTYSWVYGHGSEGVPGRRAGRCARYGFAFASPTAETARLPAVTWEG